MEVSILSYTFDKNEFAAIENDNSYQFLAIQTYISGWMGSKSKKISNAPVVAGKYFIYVET